MVVCLRVFSSPDASLWWPSRYDKYLDAIAGERDSLDLRSGGRQAGGQASGQSREQALESDFLDRILAKAPPPFGAAIGGFLLAVGVLVSLCSVYVRPYA